METKTLCEDLTNAISSVMTSYRSTVSIQREVSYTVMTSYSQHTEGGELHCDDQLQSAYTDCAPVAGHHSVTHLSLYADCAPVAGHHSVTHLSLYADCAPVAGHHSVTHLPLYADCAPVAGHHSVTHLSLYADCAPVAGHHSVTHLPLYADCADCGWSSQCNSLYAELVITV